ncbi:UNVERIFIED_CONTAM: hypothetical protein Slati_3732000 [Sesamum latifolium]|uniref:Uncharacterized protein n=1 Tax=Sesamum latifolium TaxID=2727402 RepID=A0AAW2U4H2_9LAMI
MTNPSKGIDQGTYEENPSLLPASGLGDPTLGDFIMDTVDLAVRRSQTSGMGPSSQAERGGTPASHGTGEPTQGNQQDTSLLEFGIKETAGQTPTHTLQSLEREVMKLRQQVNKEILPTERGVPFGEHIMAEELPTHFRAPTHLPMYDGSADPAEHICNFENAALLHSGRKERKKGLHCQNLNTSTGYLKDYVDKEKKREQREGRSRKYNTRQEEDPQKKKYKKKGNLEEGTSTDNTPAKGIIHMIAGGPIDGDSRRARCAHACAAKTIMKIDDKVPAEALTIQFGLADTQGVHFPHNDTLVISATVANYTVKRIFVDSGSSMDILFLKVYRQMKLGDIPLEPVDTSLYGFTGEVVHPLDKSHSPSP